MSPPLPPECVVYTPSNILNQSHVVIMFASGAGVEVMENRGFLGTRIYLPLSFAVSGMKGKVRAVTVGRIEGMWDGVNERERRIERTVR